MFGALLLLVLLWQLLWLLLLWLLMLMLTIMLPLLLLIPGLQLTHDKIDLIFVLIVWLIGSLVQQLINPTFDFLFQLDSHKVTCFFGHVPQLCICD